MATNLDPQLLAQLLAQYRGGSQRVEQNGYSLIPQSDYLGGDGGTNIWGPGGVYRAAGQAPDGIELTDRWNLGGEYLGRDTDTGNSSNDLLRNLILGSLGMYAGVGALNGMAGGTAAGTAATAPTSSAPVAAGGSSSSIVGPGLRGSLPAVGGLTNAAGPTASTVAGAAAGAAAGGGLMGALVQTGLPLAAELLTRPDQVDPMALAQQQTDANLTAAQVQNQMNRVDTFTPMGSQVFNRVADPSAPGGYRYTNTISLSPEQQQLYNSITQANQQRANMANAGLANLADRYGTPFSLAGHGTALSVPMDNIAQMDRVGTGSNFQTAQANPLGELELMDTGAAPSLQRFQGTSPVARDLFGQTGYSASVDAVRQSVLDQFENVNRRQFGLQSADLEAKLKGMGLTEGTEAYDRELRNLREAQGMLQNDATQRAILAGGSEQSRLANIDLAADAQRFGQQQQVGFLNPLAQATFNNAASQSEYNNLLAAFNQRNDARNQSQQNELMRAAQANQAESARVQTALQQAGFNNSASQTDMENWLTAAGFNNNVRQQNIQNSLVERAQPLNEFNAFMQGNQAQLPEFQPFGQASVQPGNVQAAGQYQQQQNNANANRQAGYYQQAINAAAQQPWSQWFSFGG